MEKLITYDNLRRYAYSNDALIKGRIHGIVLEFSGLGSMKIYQQDPADALEYAEQGICYVIPYHNPWCWMNEQTVSFTDEIVAVLMHHYQLDNSVRIVSTGKSMGGLSALVYTAYAHVTPCACVVNCPVCDLPFHMTEREDLPRTLYSAFADRTGTMEEALRAHSPLHLVERMPDIPYTVFHCCRDEAVRIDRHSEPFVTAMRGHRVTYIKVPLRGHCDLSPDARVQYQQAVLQAFTD